MTEFREFGPFLDALFLEAHRTLSARDLNHRMAARVRIPCLPIPGFPEFTASGHRFRVPGFCSAIKPRFLLVQWTSDSASSGDFPVPETNNTAATQPRLSGLEARERVGTGNALLDMNHLLAYLAPRVNPKVSQAVARVALVEVESLWQDLLVELRPKPEMRDEFLIAYFYQPVLGCGKTAAHNAETWRHARAAWLSSVGIASFSSAKSASRTNSDPGPARTPPHPFTAAVDWSEEDRLIDQLARRKPKKGSAALGGAETYAPPAPLLPAPPRLEELGQALDEYYSKRAMDPSPVVVESGMGWGDLTMDNPPYTAALLPQPPVDAHTMASSIDIASVLAALLGTEKSPEMMMAATVTSSPSSSASDTLAVPSPTPSPPQPAVVQDPPLLDLALELFRQLYPFAIPQQ